MDIKRYERNPHPMKAMDVLQLEPRDLWGYDLIHASPPCQAHSSATPRRHRHRHADLIPAVRRLLRASGRPYVIENVPRAPLRDPITLCGSMFEGLRVRRHRLFECSFELPQPPCGEHQPVYLSTKMAHREAMRRGERDPYTEWVSCAGSISPLDAHQDAMGIDWMSRRELVQAIPPAYTQWIAERFIEQR